MLSQSSITDKKSPLIIMPAGDSTAGRFSPEKNSSDPLIQKMLHMSQAAIQNAKKMNMMKKVKMKKKENESVPVFKRKLL